MRTFLTTCFYLFFVLSAVSIIALLSQPFQRADVILAISLTALAALLYVVRYAYLVRFGRLGLLKPKLHWKPLKRDAFQQALQISSAWHISAALAQKGHSKENDINVIVYNELQKIKPLGYSRKVRSNDELLSENKLLRFIEMDKPDRNAPPTHELRGVRRKDVCLRLRKLVDDWHAEHTAATKAYQDWLAEVGDVDQSHLLKDGWIAFLESLPSPDINLWHGIATDFHDMFGDRLDAAFWIVEQEECDRATASDFIAGYLRFNLSAEYADITKPDEGLDRFVSIIKAYNSGRYKSHALAAGTHIGHEFALDDVAASEILSEYQTAHGLTDLPRPMNLIKSTTPAPDPNPSLFASPYAFSDDVGLHLKYPGPNWRSAAQN
ncbi:MAG: hypothetical protein ABJU46_06905 [Paracoccaceae bacterium]